jgi:hypothetical protein
MATDEEILTAAYRSFNAREIDAVLSLMSADVDWANGMTGGRVHGHAEVRQYWTRQWAMVNPRVEPVGFKRGEDGRVVVSVHQVVRDLEGKLLMDRMVEHLYAMERGLIQRMDIRELPGN